ncbi:hypothetical protein BZL30_1611 [Mycobacterium kansasii]|uniref:Uncharacterized protein n=1 Tax=Mycobacterium kansasii TaxID=1768 RepID=A0A1V3XH30_MYCKA|nr:hypothetical protein BZL30_1611 [Mycobacterium kansasii]
MMGRQQLSRVAATVADEFANRLTRWERFAQTGEPIDLQHEINGVVIPAFMRAMFTMGLCDAELHRLDVDVRTLMQSASSPLLLGARRGCCRATGTRASLVADAALGEAAGRGTAGRLPLLRRPAADTS